MKELKTTHLRTYRSKKHRKTVMTRTSGWELLLMTDSVIGTVDSCPKSPKSDSQIEWDFPMKAETGAPDAQQTCYVLVFL
jgi:hypothetical protein